MPDNPYRLHAGFDCRDHIGIRITVEQIQIQIFHYLVLGGKPVISQRFLGGKKQIFFHRDFKSQ